MSFARFLLDISFTTLPVVFPIYLFALSSCPFVFVLTSLLRRTPL